MKEQPLLKAGILADIHLWCNYPFRGLKLKRALRQMRRKDLDAFVSLGDTTDHGNPEHWELADRCFREVPPARELIIGLGNHDTWTPVKDEDKDRATEIANELYMKHREIISGNAYDRKVYFTHKVNGFAFINLASEGDGVGAYISDEQIKWLDEQMAEASKDSKPVFVTCHQAINKTHGLPATFGDKEYTEMTGGIGPQSDAVKEILKKYRNVFFFSGHSHMGLVNRKEYSTYEEVEGVHSFNLPCYMFFNHDGRFTSGIGYYMNVYEDRVEMKAFNFNHHMPLHKYDYTVKISR